MLLRHHRQDKILKTSALAVFGALALLVAAPMVVPQTAGDPVPLFKPYRLQETAQITPSDAVVAE